MDKQVRDRFDADLAAEPRPPKPFEGDGNKNVEALMLLTRSTAQQASSFGKQVWDPRAKKMR